MKLTWYDKFFTPETYRLKNGREVQERFTRAPLFWLVAIALVTGAVKVTNFNLAMFIQNSGDFGTMVGRLLTPDWSYIRQIIPALLDTLKMSLLGSFLGSFVALPMAILAANNIIRFWPLNWLMRISLMVIRTIPTLVIALIATYIFGLGTFAGTIAITFFSLSFVGKQLFEYIETVDMGAYEALIASGATSTRAFFATVLPQILPTYLSTALFSFEGNVRHAAILGYVGAGGIGIVLNQKISWREYGHVGAILLALFITVIMIETVSQQLRRRLS